MSEFWKLDSAVDVNMPSDPGPAWDRWRAASCEEWNGGHLWMLTIDCGSASLACSAGCGHELYPDAAEVLVGEFPVKANVQVERHQNFEYPDEYDVWVEVVPA